jgi:hypothetical protein
MGSLLPNCQVLSRAGKLKDVNPLLCPPYGETNAVPGKVNEPSTEEVLSPLIRIFPYSQGQPGTQPAIAPLFLYLGDPTMRRLLFFILVLLIGAGVYLFVFQRGLVDRWFHQAEKKLGGYDKADTPEKAAAMFVKAIKARNYNTAADYCAGDYALQLRKVADKAARLGKQIDHLLEKLGKSGNVDSPKVRGILMLLDPFPTAIKYKVDKDGPEAWHVTFEEDQKLPQLRGVNLRALVPYSRALASSLVNGQKVALKKTMDGDQVWKVQIPVTAALQERIQRLDDKADAIVETLKTVDAELVNDRTPRPELEDQFASRLLKAMK